MAYQAFPRSASGVNDSASYARNLALADLGLTATPERMLFYHWPLYVAGNQFAASSAVSGTGSAATALQGWTLSTGATSGSRSIIAPTTSGLAQRWFVPGAAKKLWVASQFAITTAVGAGDEIGRFLTDYASLPMVMGVHGTTSTGFFSAWCDSGGAITTTTAVDTSTHIHRFWRDGTTGNYQVDNNARVQGNIRPVAAGNLGSSLEIVNGTANNRSATFTWVAWATERE